MRFMGSETPTQQNNVQLSNPFAHQMFEVELEERRLALQEKKLKLMDKYEERLKVNGQLLPTVSNVFHDYAFKLFLQSNQAELQWGYRNKVAKRR